MLRKRLGSGQDQAVETAKDLKYVRERQQIHALGVSKSFFQFECFLFLYRVSSWFVAAKLWLASCNCQLSARLFPGQERTMSMPGCVRSATWFAWPRTKMWTHCCRSSWGTSSNSGGSQVPSALSEWFFFGTLGWDTLSMYHQWPYHLTLGFNLTLEDPQPKPEITLSFFEACRYIVCLVDFTSMPANAKQVQSSMNVLSTVLGMGSTNIGHVQMPLFHKQTKENTVNPQHKDIKGTRLVWGLFDQLLVKLKTRSSSIFT